MWPREFAWASGILFDQKHFQPEKTEEERQKTSQCRFVPRPRCVRKLNHLQLSLSLSLFLLFTLPIRTFRVIKGKEKTHQLYGHHHETIKVRRTRHAGHCWKSRDELIRDVLLWTSSYSRAKAGQPARTYIQQLCVDTGYSPEDKPEAMNDREEWREMVWDIRAGGTTWWWWLRYIYTAVLLSFCVIQRSHWIWLNLLSKKWNFKVSDE